MQQTSYAKTLPKDDTALRKQARRKYLAKGIALGLIKANPSSPYIKDYWSMFYCKDTIAQNPKTLEEHTRRCGERFCIVCAGIETARMLGQYQHAFEELGPEWWFVTLTIRNMPTGHLREAYTKMKDAWRLIRTSKVWRKLKPDGIIKLETTINSDTREFHPHFHIAVNSREAADYMLRRWLEIFPYSTSEKGQDIRRCKDGDYIELFKYCFKPYSLDSNGKAMPIDYERLDEIIQCMKGIRAVQPFGKMHPDKDAPMAVIEEPEDDLADLGQEVEDFLIWRYMRSDWYCIQTGEKRSSWEPSGSWLDVMQEDIDAEREGENVAENLAG